MLISYIPYSTSSGLKIKVSLPSLQLNSDLSRNLEFPKATLSTSLVRRVFGPQVQYQMEGAGFSLVDEARTTWGGILLPSLPSIPCTVSLPREESVQRGRRYTAPEGKEHIKKWWDVLQNTTARTALTAYLIPTHHFLDK